MRKLKVTMTLQYSNIWIIKLTNPHTLSLHAEYLWNSFCVALLIVSSLYKADVFSQVK